MTTFPIVQAVLDGEHDDALIALREAITRRLEDLDPHPAMATLTEIAGVAESCRDNGQERRAQEGVNLFRQVKSLDSHPHPLVRAYAKEVKRHLLAACFDLSGEALDRRIEE